MLCKTKALYVIPFFLGIIQPLSSQSPYKAYKCPCLDSVCIDSTTGRLWRDDRVRAYTGLGTKPLDIRGVMKFDLSSVPDKSNIIAVYLNTTTEYNYGVPYKKPVVDVFWSSDDSWTRANATKTSAIPNAWTSRHIIDFSRKLHVWPLDIGGHDFKQDLKDNKTTIGIDNIKRSYSFVYFYGPKSASAQRPYLEVVVGGGPTKHLTIGAGCNDSKGFKVKAVISEGIICLGRPIPFRIETSPTVSLAAIPIIASSNTSWSGIPLPFNLAPIGAPGCKVWASGTFIFPPMTMPPGGAAFEPVVPNLQILRGVPINMHAVILDKAANALGLVTTNAVKCILW